MPMPPPKPSTVGPDDRQVSHEMGQIVRTMKEEGPQTPEHLVQNRSRTVYWRRVTPDEGTVSSISS